MEFLLKIDGSVVVYPRSTGLDVMNLMRLPENAGYYWPCYQSKPDDKWYWWGPDERMSIVIPYSFVPEIVRMHVMVS